MSLRFAGVTGLKRMTDSGYRNGARSLTTADGTCSRQVQRRPETSVLGAGVGMLILLVSGVVIWANTSWH